MSSNIKIKEYIKTNAKQLGFADARFAKATFLEREAPRLEKWLRSGYHGEMLWMENYFDKRLDPRLLLDGCKTVVIFSHNYYPSTSLNLRKYKISKYAYGEDYHRVLKDKMKELMTRVTGKFGEINYRLFVDSGPVMERVWAERSGLGWVGKHSLLLTKGQGSYYFLATLLMDIEIDQDPPVTDHCGTCTRCIEACPTDAIVKPYVVDSNRCISYLTIEYKKELPPEFKDQMRGWIFGCDICQEVCPWNRFSKAHTESRFDPLDQLKDVNDEILENLENELFDRIFSKSAVKRTKFDGLKRNIEFVKER